ncbi:MAG: hypothetical protein AB1696_13465 [Planctomycetota bacterium]
MKKAMAFGVMVAGMMFFSGVALADGPWESYGKHMEKYHKHMAEAAEEAEDGDWDDYYEELGKANAHRNAAEFNRRIAEPWFAPRFETPTYNYGPRYYTGPTYSRRSYIDYGPGCRTSTTYYYSW